MEKSPNAFRTISEVAQDLALPQHVLRFWETRFTQIKPLKRGGGRRYYRPDDVELLRSIRHLLYADGYTIKGVQRLLRENGARALAAAAAGERVAQGGREASTAEAEPQPGAEEPQPASEPLHAQESELVVLLGEDRALPTPTTAAFDREKLRAVLADLAECERLLAAARNL